MPFTRPSSIPTPFASAALPSYINTLPTSPSGSNLASWQEGFPPVTMTLAGGLPPEGQDFNGVLNRISAGLQWVQAGGPPAYDSALATAIGGYPKGAVLALNDGFTFVISVADNNMNNPNTAIYGATNWAPFGGTLASAGNFGADSGVANAYVIAADPPLTANYNGLWVTFKVLHTNTGASTLNAGGGVVPLVRNDGVSLAASDLVANAVYTAVFESATNRWLLETLVASQTAANKAHLVAYNTTPLGLTADGAARMMGMGVGRQVTPLSTGNLLVTIEGSQGWVGAAGSGTFQIRYGTGTPPANNATPAVGTAIGGVVTIKVDGASSAVYSFSRSMLVAGLTVGVPYWFDLVAQTTASGFGPPIGADISIVEV